MSWVYILAFCGLSVLILLAGNANGYHDDCPDSFNCGSLGMIHFPFTKPERRECGALAIYGCDDLNQTATKHVQLNNGKKVFRVTKVDNQGWWHSSISIIDSDFSHILQTGNCNAFSYNISLPPTSPFAYFYVENNITIFKCNKTLPVSVRSPNNFFKNNTCCPSFDFYFGPSNSYDNTLHSSCSMLHLPVVEGFQLSANPFKYLIAEFTIKIKFSDNCDRCKTDAQGKCRLKRGKFYCARRKSHVLTRKLELLLGIGIGPWIIFGLILTLRDCRRKYCRRRAQLESSDIESDKIFFGVPVFSYKELQEATNNFDRTKRLGDGGFGIVYYGKLRDGREVAIKHLFEHNYKRVEQFMNEIEILTRLRHRNLVSLYGCTSRHSHELLLVYEYIPNGTVADHLHGDLSRISLLTWPIRMQIAIDTATALAYLHASNIIHRDVKTNNILLDINFSVKVADFGLSRLVPNDVSHVSTAPQGSPGYLDPEYFQCYRLTDKSDVYSFGVVLMELISSMPAVDTTRERDEINLANIVTKKIQKGKLNELLDPSLGFKSDHEVKRMLASVAELAFRCVQADKELRPSIDDVLEALKNIAHGKFESEDLKQGGDGAGISYAEQLHPPPSASQDSDQLEFIINKKLPASPRSLTEKWESESTTPNANA